MHLQPIDDHNLTYGECGVFIGSSEELQFCFQNWGNIWGKNSPDLRHLFIFHMFLYFTSDLVNIMNCTC